MDMVVPDSKVFDLFVVGDLMEQGELGIQGHLLVVKLVESNFFAD